MIYDDMGPVEVISRENLEPYVSKRKINITEAEIQDKSKGDALSKGIVILQTSWFILQCIARVVEGLPITELELVTLAFATLNTMTYALWWYKPLNVECSVRVYGTRTIQPADGTDTGPITRVDEKFVNH